MTSFLHLTDLHLRAPAAEAAMGEDAPSARLRAVLSRTATLEPRPEFVAITGDLANGGAPEAYRLLAEILGECPLPVLLTLGNHDDRAAFRAVFGGTAGPVCQDRVLGGLHLIALDTLVTGRTGGALSRETLGWLEEALERQPDLPKLVLLHHPPRAPWTGENAWDALTAASTEALAKRLEGRPIAGLLAGHVHFDGVRIWQGAPLAVNTGLATAIDPATSAVLHVTEGASYALCRWADGALSVSFVPVAPARAELQQVAPGRLRGGG